MRGQYIPIFRSETFSVLTNLIFRGEVRRKKKEFMILSCREVWKEISNYLEGEVDAALRADLEAHFAQCRHCTALLDGTRNVIVLTVDQRTFTLPAGFSQRLQERLRIGAGK